MFRLHLDIQLGDDEEKAAKMAEEIVKALGEAIYSKRLTNKLTLQYRLGKDEDRGNRNYLSKDANGHVSTGKVRILI